MTQIPLTCWHSDCSNLGTQFENITRGKSGEVIKEMLAEYMKRLTQKQVCPVVLSITDTTEVTETKAVIHRNHIQDAGQVKSADLYLRARKIYLRARRHRPVRAASIF